MDNDKDFGKKVKKAFSATMKRVSLIGLKIILPIVLIVIILSASIYLLTYDDAEYKEGDMSSAPYANKQYQSNVTIDANGNINTAKSAQEIWDEMNKSGSRANLYLESASELKRLMNAENITQYLDTRPNPDEKIDWEKLFKDPKSELNDPNSTKVQGIIKLKRAGLDGSIKTLTYIDPETFQSYITEYNNSGSESAKEEAMKHFTIEQSYSSPGGTFGESGTISAGTAIEIPSEYGINSYYTYMAWQNIKSPSSAQYKLREQAGMNFNEEGFGMVNGRYVVACTSTFGKAGDYIDVYYDNGKVMPCIIGDVKDPGDAGCNKWGHGNGHNIIEFVVDKNTWYTGNHGNVGTSQFHPEWEKNIVKIVNGGSYFDNPNLTGNAEQTSTQTSTTNDEMCWPSSSTTISKDYSKEHKSIEIETTEGSEVYACEDGTVEAATESSTAGKYIVINHGNGYKSKYKNNKELKVKVGDKVKKGQVIALAGNTLKFQIEDEGGKSRDPNTFKYSTKDGQEVGNGNEGAGSNVSNLDNASMNFYAKVATWSESTNTITSTDSDVEAESETIKTMTSTVVNYLDLVNGYTMPFDYLWTLLVASEGKDFVLDLSDLVYNSEIEITVHDNIQKVTTTRENNYTNKTKTVTELDYKVEYANYKKDKDGNKTDKLKNSETDTGHKTWGENGEDEVKTPQTTISTNITTTNTVDIELTYANVWIVEYKRKFKQKTEAPQTTDGGTQTLPNKEYGSSPDSVVNEDVMGHVPGFLSEVENEYKRKYDTAEASQTKVEAKIYNGKENNTIKTTIVTETTKYEGEPADIREKTDKKADEDNFVTIFCREANKNARYNILEMAASEWLFDMLEANPNTPDMVDLTKYLIKKATGRDYGVPEDFSIKDMFNPENFTPVGSNNFSEGGGTFSGDVAAICKQVTDMYLARGTTYGPQTYNNIKQTFESDNKIVCATYVSVVLYKMGVLTEQQINAFNYHFTGNGGIPNMLQAAGWHQVSKNDLKPGDVLNKPSAVAYGGGHVVMYTGNGTIWDQNSVTKRTGTGKSANYYINDPGYVAWRAP